MPLCGASCQCILHTKRLGPINPTTVSWPPQLTSFGYYRFMGSDLGEGRSRQLRRTGPSCKTVFWVGLVPFTLGLLTILAIFKAAPPVHLRQLRETRTTAASTGADCTQQTQPRPEPCNCKETADSQDLSRLQGALTRDSVTKVLDAANSSDPHTQTVRVNEDALPSIFLFVGVLSGRGYRYRQLLNGLWKQGKQVLHPLHSTGAGHGKLGNQTT